MVRGGLQERAAEASGEGVLYKIGPSLLATHTVSRPEPQVAVGLFAVLPPIVLLRVALSLWPSALFVHVALVCPTLT